MLGTGLWTMVMVFLFFFNLAAILTKNIFLFSLSPKGTVSRDFFLLLVFFMNQFPPSPRVFYKDHFEFFRKFAKIFAIQGAPPVATSFTSVVDTGGKQWKQLSNC
jgi:hypothetical protein